MEVTFGQSFLSLLWEGSFIESLLECFWKYFLESFSLTSHEHVMWDVCELDHVNTRWKD